MAVKSCSKKKKRKEKKKNIWGVGPRKVFQGNSQQVHPDIHEITTELWSSRPSGQELQVVITQPVFLEQRSVCHLF